MIRGQQFTGLIRRERRKGCTQKTFTWKTLDTWTSPKTGLQYPTTVEVSVIHPTKGQEVYRLRPLLDQQEFTGNRSDNAYWEGACEVLNEKGKRIGMRLPRARWVWRRTGCPPQLNCKGYMLHTI